MKTTEQRFWDKVDETPGHGPWGDCWLWTGAINDKGYGKFTANGSRAYRAHKYSYEIHHGPISEGLCVLHRCDVRRCVNPAHLFVGTRADNNRDTQLKGKTRGGQGKGILHPRAVLNDEIVVQILLLHGQGMTPGRIAKRLGRNRSTVKNVVYGGQWSHITLPPYTPVHPT